jgi:hypothetical protein
LASPFGFPILLGLFFLDLLLPFLKGIFLLIGVLAVAGLCAEEYVAFLRSRDLEASAALGFYSASIPPLVTFCWRPAALPEPGISLGLLTVITLALVLCALMVALSLIAEVSEKMITGLAGFLLASLGALFIGLVFAHLLLLRQVGLGPWHSLAAIILGWIFLLVYRMKSASPSSALPLILKFHGLGVAAAALFWALRGFSP